MAEFRLPKNSTLTKGVTHKADNAAQNVKTFEVYRWSPDDDANPRLDVSQRAGRAPRAEAVRVRRDAAYLISDTARRDVENERRVA